MNRGGVGHRAASLACLLALALAGCGTADREHDAGAVAQRFHAALEAGDGEAACDRLSEETALKLESEEKKPCEEAILSLQLPKGATVAGTRVYVTARSPPSPRAAATSSTKVRTAGGSPPPAASPPRRHSPTTASWRTEMRAMFVLYLCLIVGGILFFSAIGLIHN